MKSQRKSANQTNIEIADYYAVKPGPIWKEVKLENWAFWWLCVYFFLEYVRPADIYRVLDILPWGQISLALACVAAITNKSIRLVKNPANTLVIMFFVIVLLSSIFAFDPSIAADKIFIPLNWLILYYLVITIVNTEKKFFVLVLLFLLVNFKMSQHGFLSYAQRGFGYASWGLAGSPGWFQNAGDFGIQMTIFAPLAVAFILALKDYWGRFKMMIFYLFPLTALFSIVGSASRGVQLGLAATIIWFLFKARGGIKAIVGILIIGTVVYSILPEKMLEEFSAAGEDDTSEHRLAMWNYGLEVVGDHPILGVGLENWVDYCRFNKPYGVEGYKCLEAHNTYIEAATEVGITGFLVFLLSLLVIFILNARTRANAKQINNKFFWYIAHGLDGGLVGCMVGSMFFSILFYPMFWVQLAMTVALYEISKQQLNKSTESLNKPQV